MPSSGFFRSLFLVGLALLLPSLGYAEPASETTPPIQDNSFLIEEAYNQEFGVVQHTSTLTRLWNRKDWIYTFTQEWPAPAIPATSSATPWRGSMPALSRTQIPGWETSCSTIAFN